MARRYRKEQYSPEGVLALFIIFGGYTLYTKYKVYLPIIIGGVILFTGLVIWLLLYWGKKQTQKLIDSGIDLVDQMTGETFERYLLEHFKRKGYKGHLTPKSNDYGADLVLVNNQTRIVVQAKRWSQKVGIEAIQQIAGAKAHYGASEMWVITNNYFTPQAQSLAASNGVELWDRDKLLSYLKVNQARSEIQDIQKEEQRVNEIVNVSGSSYETSNSSEWAEKCPRCGNPLTKRVSKTGPFWGCSSFPKCRYTKNMG